VLEKDGGISLAAKENRSAIVETIVITMSKNLPKVLSLPPFFFAIGAYF
jgi:hypothetical protein